MSEPTSESVVLHTRTCSLCNTNEQSPQGKIFYWLPEKIPRNNVCQHCGLRGLLVNPGVRLRIYRAEPAFEWIKPHVGRPTKVLAERRRLEAEANAQAEQELHDLLAS